MFAKLIGSPVIVRSTDSGVWSGALVSVDGDVVALSEARKIWNWEGAAATSGLAAKGPTGGLICEPVGNKTQPAFVRGWCEILPSTPEALARVVKVKPWAA